MEAGILHNNAFRQYQRTMMLSPEHSHGCNFTDMEFNREKAVAAFREILDDPELDLNQKSWTAKAGLAPNAIGNFLKFEARKTGTRSLSVESTLQLASVADVDPRFLMGMDVPRGHFNPHASDAASAEFTNKLIELYDGNNKMIEEALGRVIHLLELAGQKEGLLDVAQEPGSPQGGETAMRSNV